jgi:hypothetical protein
LTLESGSHLGPYQILELALVIPDFAEELQAKFREAGR